MAKPTKKSKRVNEIMILLIVLLSAILLVTNTGQQIINELDTQVNDGVVNQLELTPPPAALPTATTSAVDTMTPDGPTPTPTPFKIFG